MKYNPWHLLLKAFVAADVWLFFASNRVEDFHAQLLGKGTHVSRIS